MSLDLHDLALVGGNALCQHIHGPLQVLLLQHIGDTHLVDALAGGFIEGRTGRKHDGIPPVGELLQEPPLEFIRIIHRQACHYIESAHRLLHNHTGDLAQLGNNGIPAALIFGLAGAEELVVNGIQGSRTHLIHGGNRQSGLAELQQRCLQFLIPGNHAAHTGTAGGEPLGNGIDDDKIIVNVPEMGHGGNTKLVVIAEFPVHLVADQEQVVLLGDVGDHPHFLLIQHNTGGIAGVGDHDGPGIGGDQALDPLPVGIAVALPGISGQSADNAAGCVNEGGIVGIVGFGDDDLGVGVQDGQAGEQQGFTATGGDQDVIVLQLYAQFLIVVLYSVDQNGAAGRGLIFQSAVAELMDRLIEGRGGGQIGLADVQMINFFAFLLGCHSQRVELPHGRGFAAVCVDGNLHNYLH